MKEASIQMIDRAGVHLVLQLSHFSLSLIAFSVMASASSRGVRFGIPLNFDLVVEF